MSLKGEVHEAEQRIPGKDFKIPALLEKCVVPCLEPWKPKGVLLSCTHQYEKAYQNVACGYSFLIVLLWDYLVLSFSLVGEQGSDFVPTWQIPPLATPGPRPGTLPALIAHLWSQRRGKTPGALNSVSLSNKTCVTPEKHLKIRHLGTKIEIGSYK